MKNNCYKITYIIYYLYMKKDSFLYKALCESVNGVSYPSSKRLAGFIGWCAVQIIILAGVVLSYIKTQTLSEGLIGLIDFDMVTSATLLGLSSITRIFKGDKTAVGSNEKTGE